MSRILIGLAACGLAACAAHSQTGSTVESKVSPEFKLSGTQSGIQSERFAVIRDTKALKSLLKEHNPSARLIVPSIDFSRQTVIGFFAGSKPTGGFSVELIGIERKKGAAAVMLRLWKPGKGSMVTQAFTSPFLILAVDILPEKVSRTVIEQERRG